MHNPVAEGIESREAGGIDLAALAPLVAVVIALGVYPQLVLERTEPATKAQIQPAREAR
jgi:NADH:ubiquinone oxidoreductase subunit 4 (subunit M)